MYQIHTVLENCLKKKPNKQKNSFFCPQNYCWNTICLLILPLLFLFFLLSAPTAAPPPSVISKARGARDVNRHRDNPTPNISWLMPSRDQSRENLMYSLKDAEFTWRLLCCGFFFSTVLLLLGRHVRSTCPTKVHISVQAGVSDQSNSK